MATRTKLTDLGYPLAPPDNPVVGDIYVDAVKQKVKAYDGATWHDATGITRRADGYKSISLESGMEIVVDKNTVITPYAPGAQSTGVHLHIPNGFPQEKDVCVEKSGWDKYCRAPLQNAEQREHRRCAKHIWNFNEVFDVSERDWIVDGNKDYRAAIIGLVRHVKQLEEQVIELNNRLGELE